MEERPIPRQQTITKDVQQKLGGGDGVHAEQTDRERVPGRMADTVPQVECTSGETA